MKEWKREQLPTDKQAMDVRGNFLAKAHWDDEQKNWVLEENETIKCDVIEWKEIEDGSTEEKDSTV